MEYGYRARLPSSVVTRIVTEGGQSGQAIARGIGGLAETAQRARDKISEAEREVEEKQRLRRKQADLFAARAALADERLATDTVIEERKRDPAVTPAGAAGYAEGALELRRQRAEAFEANLRDQGVDPEVIDQVAASLKEDVLRGALQDRAYESTKSVEHTRTSGGIWEDATGARVRAGAMPLGQALAEADGMALVLGRDATEQAAARQKAYESMVAAYAAGLIDRREFDRLEQEIDGGTMTPYLGGEKGLGKWRKAIADGRDVVARETEARADQETRLAGEALEVLGARADSPDNPPSPAEWAATISLAEARGVDPSTIERYRNKANNQQRAQSAMRLDAPELTTQAAKLREKIRTQGATPADMAQLDAYDAQLKKLGKEAGAAIGAVWKVDQRAAIAQLRAMPRSQRIEAAGGFSARAGALASISPQAAETALIGEGVRNDRAGAFMPIATEGAGKGKGSEALAEQQFKTLLGAELLNDLEGEYDTALSLALDIYTGAKARGGANAAWNPRDFANAVNQAFGATVRTSGPSAGKVQGGITRIRGKTVELPDRWTPTEFAIMLASQDYAGGGAVDGRGRSIAKADVLAYYRPTAVDEDDTGIVTYEFTDPNGRVLQRKGGGKYQLRLPQRGPGAR